MIFLLNCMHEESARSDPIILPYYIKEGNLRFVTFYGHAVLVRRLFVREVYVTDI